jgi:hypothetical protein
MATTLKQTEGTPDDFPDVAPLPALSTAAAALDPAMLWQRIESYIAHRWTARDIVWVVEGPGEWVPPLTPAVIETLEVWSCGAFEWEAVTLDASPLGGYYLPASGPYRFGGIVGDDDSELPAAVVEAFRRLAEYMAAKAGKPGATSERITAGSVALGHSRSASWMAQAMENSGAGDLLRPYRRAK